MPWECIKHKVICMYLYTIIRPLYVLDFCIDFALWVFIFSPLLSCFAQVSEGGPSHDVFASAELGPREDSGSSGRALHSSVWHQQMEGQKVSKLWAPRGCLISFPVASCFILIIILNRETISISIFAFWLNGQKIVLNSYYFTIWLST